MSGSSSNRHPERRIRNRLSKNHGHRRLPQGGADSPRSQPRRLATRKPQPFTSSKSTPSFWSAGAERSGDPALAHPAKPLRHRPPIRPHDRFGLSRLIPACPACRRFTPCGRLGLDAILTPGGHWQKSQSAVVASLCRRTPHPAHAGLGFGVRGQSAAATPLWLTRPNPSVTALPSGPMTASASPGLARLIPAASALHTYQSCTGAYSS